MINNSSKLVEYQILDSNLTYINALTNLESIVFNASDGNDDINNKYNYKFLYKHAPLFVDINTIDVSCGTIESNDPLDDYDNRKNVNVSLEYPCIGKTNITSSDITSYHILDFDYDIPNNNLIVMTENHDDEITTYKADTLLNYMNAKEMHGKNFNISDIFKNYISKNQYDILLQRMNYRILDISNNILNSLLNDEMLYLLYKNSSTMNKVYDSIEFYNECNSSLLVPGCVYKVKKSYTFAAGDVLDITLYMLAIDKDKISNDVLKYEVTTESPILANITYYNPHFKCKIVTNDICIYHVYDEKGNSFNFKYNNDIIKYFELLLHSSQNMVNAHFESMPNILYDNAKNITIKDSYIGLNNEYLDLSVGFKLEYVNNEYKFIIEQNNEGYINLYSSTCILCLGNDNNNLNIDIDHDNELVIIGNENDSIELGDIVSLNALIMNHPYYIIGNANSNITIDKNISYNIHILNNNLNLTFFSNNTTILSPLSLNNYKQIDPLWSQKNPYGMLPMFGTVPLYNGIHDYALIFNGSIYNMNDSSLRNSIEFIANPSKYINEVLNKLPNGIGNNKQHESFIYGNIEKYNGIANSSDISIYYVTDTNTNNNALENIIKRTTCEYTNPDYNFSIIDYAGCEVNNSNLNIDITDNRLSTRVEYKIYPVNKNIESEDIVKIQYNRVNNIYDSSDNIYKLIHLYYSYDMHSYYARLFYNIYVQDNLNANMCYSLEFYDDIEKYTFDSSDLIVNVNLYDTYNPSIYKKMKSNISAKYEVLGAYIKGFSIKLNDNNVLPNTFEFGLYGKNISYTIKNNRIYTPIYADEYNYYNVDYLTGNWATTFSTTDPRSQYPEEFNKIPLRVGNNRHSPYGYLWVGPENDKIKLSIGNGGFPNYVEFAKFKPYIKTDKATYIFNYENNYIPKDALYFTTNLYNVSAILKIYSDNKNIVKFSYDYINWYDFALVPNGIEITNKKLYIKGKLALDEKIRIEQVGSWQVQDGVYAFGNIGYLLNESPYAAVNPLNQTTFNTIRTCEGLFENCIYLKSAPDLPIGNKLEIQCSSDSSYKETYMTYKPSYFKNMFKGCVKLELAPKLPNICTNMKTDKGPGGRYGLDNTYIIYDILYDNIFEGMFENCKLLSKLQNTYIKFRKCLKVKKEGINIYYNNAICKSACKNMFKGCVSLTLTLDLPTQTLAESCYESMYEDCEDLVVALDILPASTLADNCYKSMFKECILLEKAPELPATTLNYGCYDSMFYGCSSLEIAPYLPALKLVNRCYHKMFYDCPSLMYIEAAFNSYDIKYSVALKHGDTLQTYILINDSSYINLQLNDKIGRDYALSGCTYLMLGGTTNGNSFNPKKIAKFSTFAVNNTYNENGLIIDPSSGNFVDTSIYESTYNTVEHTKKVLNKLCIFYDRNWDMNNIYHKNGYYITTTDDAYKVPFPVILRVIHSYITSTSIESIYYDKTNDSNETFVKCSNFNVGVDSIGIKLNSYINSSLRIESGYNMDWKWEDKPIITKGTQIILNTSNCFDIAFRNKTDEYYTYDFTRIGLYDKLDNIYGDDSYKIFSTSIGFIYPSTSTGEDIEYTPDDRRYIDVLATLTYRNENYNNLILTPTLYNKILTTIRKNNLNYDEIYINSMNAPVLPQDTSKIPGYHYELLHININDLEISDNMVKDIYDNASTYFAQHVWCESPIAGKELSTLKVFLDIARSKNNRSKQYFKLKNIRNYPIQKTGIRDIDSLLLKVNTTIENTINTILSRVLENKRIYKYQIIGKLQFYKKFSNDTSPFQYYELFQYNDIILLPKYNEYVNLLHININDTSLNNTNEKNYVIQGNIISGYDQYYNQTKITLPINVHTIESEEYYSYNCIDASKLRFNPLNNNTYDANGMFLDSSLVYAPKYLPTGNYNNMFKDTSLVTLPILLDINNSSLNNFVVGSLTGENNKILKNINYNEIDSSLSINELRNMILEVDESNLNNYELWTNNMTKCTGIYDSFALADINYIEYIGNEDAFLKFNIDENDFNESGDNKFECIFEHLHAYTSAALENIVDSLIYIGFKSKEKDNMYYFILINNSLYKLTNTDHSCIELYSGVNIKKYYDTHLLIDILDLSVGKHNKIIKDTLINSIRIPYSKIDSSAGVYVNIVNKNVENSLLINTTLFQVNDVSCGDDNHLVKLSLSGDLEKFVKYHNSNIRFNSTIVVSDAPKYTLSNLYSAKYLKCNNINANMLFKGCSNLKYPPLYMNNIIDNKDMFNGCTSLLYTPIMNTSVSNDFVKGCNNLSYINIQSSNLSDIINLIANSGSNKGIMILSDRELEKATKLAIKNTTYKDWLIYSKDEEKEHLAKNMYWVDLGDAGIWAKYNLGVNPNLLSTALDWYGNYYAWGETTSKQNYSWETYAYGSNYDSLTKYCPATKPNYWAGSGDPDNLKVLTLGDDVANIMGLLETLPINCKIPNRYLIDNLINNTTYKWVTKYQNITGLNGAIFTSSNGNELFIPAAGYYNNSNVINGNFRIWYSQINTIYPYTAMYLYGNTTYDTAKISNESRSFGLSIRPVFVE